MQFKGIYLDPAKDSRRAVCALCWTPGKHDTCKPVDAKNVFCMYCGYEIRPTKERL